MWFADLARNLLAGRGFVSDTLYPMFAHQTTGFPVAEPFKQVGYPLLTAMLWRFTEIGHRPMLLIALLGFAALIGFSYLLARQVLDSRSRGVVVAALVACSPPLLALNTAATPEPLFSALFVALLWLLLRPTLGRVAWGGMCQALMILTKGIGIIYLPLVLAYLFLRGDARALRTSATYLGSFLLTVATVSLLLPAGSVQVLGSGSNSASRISTGSRLPCMQPRMMTAHGRGCPVNCGPGWASIHCRPRTA